MCIILIYQRSYIFIMNNHRHRNNFILEQLGSCTFSLTHIHQSFEFEVFFSFDLYYYYINIIITIISIILNMHAYI